MEESFKVLHPNWEVLPHLKAGDALVNRTYRQWKANMANCENLSKVRSKEATTDAPVRTDHGAVGRLQIAEMEQPDVVIQHVYKYGQQMEMLAECWGRVGGRIQGPFPPRPIKDDHVHQVVGRKQIRPHHVGQSHGFRHPGHGAPELAPLEGPSHQTADGHLDARGMASH